MQQKRRFSRPGLYLAWMGQAGGEWAFPVAHALRRRGISVEMEGGAKSLKSQMRRADKLKVRHVLIVGDDELSKGKGILRDMDSKEQVEVNLAEVETELAVALPALSGRINP